MNIEKLKEIKSLNLTNIRVTQHKIFDLTSKKVAINKEIRMLSDFLDQQLAIHEEFKDLLDETNPT